MTPQFKLPASFLRDGFTETAPTKRRRLMISSEGETESGKTEFIASCPGPGIIICLDRGHEAMLENAKPPKSRRNDFAYKVIPILLASQAQKDDFGKAWAAFKEQYYKALNNPDALTVGLDTDNASWELQQLAEFGRLAQIPPIMRTGVNAARRAFIARAYDSGKNVIATNMLKNEYKTVVDEEGRPVLKDGKEQQERTGERTRQGFADSNYLWQVQLLHMVKPSEVIEVPGKLTVLNGKAVKAPATKQKTPVRYGIKILKCKMNSALVGEELWDEQCNFAGLVTLMYPDIPLKVWGF